MPRLNKPLVAHLEKIPAKTHSGLYYRYTFQLNEAGSKNLSKAAKVAGISEAEYCKRQVLKSFGNFRLAKLASAGTLPLGSYSAYLEKSASPQKATAKPAAYTPKQLGELVRRATSLRLGSFEAEIFGRYVEFLCGDVAWKLITATQVCGVHEANIVHRITLRFVELGLLERRQISNKNRYEYRLCTDLQRVKAKASAFFIASSRPLNTAELDLLLIKANDAGLNNNSLNFYVRVVRFLNDVGGWHQMSSSGLAKIFCCSNSYIYSQFKSFIDLKLLEYKSGSSRVDPNKYRLPILSKYTPQELEQHKALNSKNGGAQ